jgi:hypothetical protein
MSPPKGFKNERMTTEKNLSQTMKIKGLVRIWEARGH